MMPTYSGGIVIAILVIFALVIAGGIAIIAAVNELFARVIGRELGCLVGGAAALGWLWLLARVENERLSVYAVVLIGIPAAVTVFVRTSRPDRRRSSSGS